MTAISYHELQACLDGLPEFADLSDWRITRITVGRTSPHCYRLHRGERDLFFKVIKPNERITLGHLYGLGLRHVPQVLYPQLLDRRILITPYQAGGTIQDRELEPGLIEEYALIQNRLNRPPYMAEPPFDRGGGFRRYFLACFAEAEAMLRRLAPCGWPVVARYAANLAGLAPRREQLAAEYSAMPFAWVHHDFREENILAGPPQQISDWGSSYGPGPFLYDLAPFLRYHRANRELFWRCSHIAQAAPRVAAERWLYVAACARLTELLRYLFELTTERAVEAYLEYHEPVYAGLGGPHADH